MILYVVKYEVINIIKRLNLTTVCIKFNLQTAQIFNQQ